MTVHELQKALDDAELSYDVYPQFEPEIIRRELEGAGCVEVDEALEGMIGSLRVKGLDVLTDRYEGLMGESITTTIIIYC